jgi:hypothetical protein
MEELPLDRGSPAELFPRDWFEGLIRLGPQDSQDLPSPQVRAQLNEPWSTTAPLQLSGMETAVIVHSQTLCHGHNFKGSWTPLSLKNCSSLRNISAGEAVSSILP